MIQNQQGLLTTFFSMSLLHAPLIVGLICVFFLAVVLSFVPFIQTKFAQRVSDSEQIIMYRRYFVLVLLMLISLLILWYYDAYITYVGLKFYPFAFILLAMTVMAGYRLGFLTYILSLPLITYYLIYPRYEYFPSLFNNYLLDVILELFVGFVIGCVIRHYQDSLWRRLFNAREELQFTALEKIAMQSEERALLRAIDTSSEVVTSSELSLTSILSTSQYWLSNVLKIVSEETRHLVNGRFAGIGFIKNGEFEIVTLAKDKRAQKEKDKLAQLFLEGVLKSLVPNLDVIKEIELDQLESTISLPNDNLGFTKILACPIVSKQKTIGTLFITNNQNSKDFNEFDKRRLQLFASYAGLSIVNMHHYEKLSGLVEGRDQLLSMVSHELKTPLSTIKLYAQLMQEQVGGDKDHKELHRGLMTIDQEVDKLTMLVNSIQDFSRIRSGIFEIERKEFNLAKLCQDRISIVKQLYPDHHFTLAISHDSRMIVADQLRIEQILTNLIINAAKYSAPGTTISLRLRRTPQQYTIAVKDQGQGISLDDQAHIFEPFYQANQAGGHAKGKGLGLGLYIAKEIVIRHGGKVWVDSVPGKGATFYVTLPILAKSVRLTKTVNGHARSIVAVSRKLRSFALSRPH